MRGLAKRAPLAMLTLSVLAIGSVDEEVSLLQSDFKPKKARRLGFKTKSAKESEPNVDAQWEEAPASVKKCVADYADELDQVRPSLGDAIRVHPMLMRGNSTRSMVIGAGSGTTGHRTLATALSLLNMNPSYAVMDPWKRKYFAVLNFGGGFKQTCHKTLEKYDYSEVPQGVDAIFDTPVAELFLNFYLAFPQAKVLLSTRPADDWVEHRMKWRISPMPMQEPCGKFLFNFAKNRTEIGRLFELNNELVRCVVPKDQLFEVNLWEDSAEQMRGLLTRLSKFLGRESQLPKDGPIPKSLRLSVLDEDPGFHPCADARVTGQDPVAGSFSLNRPVPYSFAASDKAAVSTHWSQQIGELMQDLAKAECDLVP